MNIESGTFRFHGQSGCGFSRRQMALKVRLKPKLLLEQWKNAGKMPGIKIIDAIPLRNSFRAGNRSKSLKMSLLKS